MKNNLKNEWMGRSVFALLVIAYCFYANIFTLAYWERFFFQFHLNFIEGDRWLWIVYGLKNTLIMTVGAGILGVIIGILLSVVRVAHEATGRFRILHRLANVYVTVIRGTPVMVQILFINFGVLASVSVNKLIVASVAFGINSGAYVAEIFRAGIESIDPGQMEAGRSLGLSYTQTMKKIILPQATRNVLPTLFNELITLVKESSIAGYIALDDLTRQALNIQSVTFDATQPLMMAALVYLVVVMLLTQVMKWMERKLKIGDR